MARAYECSECEHVQIVGVIDNGLSGFADPDEVCESCGAVGQFHFGPGVARQTREQIANPVMAERLAAQRAWNEHQRWLADARQKLAEADPPSAFIEPDELSVEPEQGCAWLLWGRHADRGSMPLGCYRTRQVALDAEELHKAHENAGEWEDIWVVPWPLMTEPRVNFRMKHSWRGNG